MRKLLIPAVAGAGLYALLLWTDTPETQSADRVTQDSASQAAPAEKEFSPEDTVPTAEVAVIPSADKDFILASGIKDVLDNIILSADSTDTETILTYAQQHCLQQQLHSAGCDAFLRLLQTYLEYKIALQALEPESMQLGSALANIREQLQRLESLRRAYFTNDEFSALFGEEQHLNEQALARREIALSHHLSRDQKQSQIEAQLRNLPEAQRSAFAPTLAMRDLSAIKQRYGDQQSRLLEAENQFGKEAADRLAQLWQQQESFEEQLSEVAQQWQEMTQSDNLPADSLDTLLAQHFSGNQLRRAKAILKYR